MANNILITPGSASIQFSGSNANTIRLQVENSGSIAFYGNSGSLFSIADQLSGSLMSVNDISGLPILEVFSDDRVVMGTVNKNTLVVTGSRVGILRAVPSYSLHVTGTIFSDIISASFFSGNGAAITGVTATLPAGVVSSSTQFITLSDRFTGSFTGSFTGDGANLTNLTLPAGVVSSSTQFKTLADPFTGSFTGSFNGNGTNLRGVVSSSYAATASYLEGSIEGGITGSFSGSGENIYGVISSSYALSASYAPLPAGVVSSSTQFITLSDRFTGSFTGSFTGDGSGLTNIPGVSPPFPFIGDARITGSLRVTGSVLFGEGASLNAVPEILAVSSSTYNAITAHANINSYLQTNVHNLSAGGAASSDYVATADTGTEFGEYIDMGINSSGFTPGTVIGGPLDGYLYMTSSVGELHVGNAGTSNTSNIRFFTSGTNSDNVTRMFISSSGQVAIGTGITGSAGNIKLFVSGAVSSSTYYGDGSNLTGLAAGTYNYGMAVSTTQFFM